MISIASLRQSHTCDETECIRCSHAPTVVYECRHCGASATAGTMACSHCGRTDIVQYTI
ncbi:hypothetical protein ACFQJ5_10695 [Halomicroarcula sp. GCM10025324]|uniref:hypothetical protein n=1 Tax=Haloarcula TaxID=2237 RepID=UPI0023E7B94F|nr:hypothetical protein [Halomicroarcula sp. ZS-22-S1]